MNFSFYIARRYLFTKSKNNAINYITLIASLGIIIGASALFIVLSGFSGLKAFSLEFTALTDPDLKVFPAKSKSFVFSQEDRNKLSKIEGIASYSEVVEDNVLMNCEDRYLAIQLKGVDIRYPKKTVDSILVYGDWFEAGLPQVVSGWGVTNSLGFSTYDITKTIKLYAPRPGTGQIFSVKDAFKSLKVVNSGVFKINDELNNSLVFTSIENARYLLGLANFSLSSIEISIESGYDTDKIVSEIKKEFGNHILIKNRIQLNESLYKMLNTEQLAVYLIFTLILIIALFNIIGSIVMMVLDKKHNIKTLFSLGARKKVIQNIFFTQGLLMTIFGGLLGILLGVCVIAIQLYFKPVLITPTLPYPVVLSWTNIFISFSTILILGTIASRLASLSVKKIELTD